MSATNYSRAPRQRGQGRRAYNMIHIPLGPIVEHLPGADQCIPARLRTQKARASARCPNASDPDSALTHEEEKRVLYWGLARGRDFNAYRIKILLRVVGDFINRCFTLNETFLPCFIYIPDKTSCNLM